MLGLEKKSQTVLVKGPQDSLFKMHPGAITRHGKQAL